jgi:hypothetical protein
MITEQRLQQLEDRIAIRELICLHGVAATPSHCRLRPFDLRRVTITFIAKHLLPKLNSEK